MSKDATSGTGKGGLLLVSYHFAPSVAVGGKRFSYLSGLFGQAGYEVHVVAARLGRKEARDASIPSAGQVHRAGVYPPYPVARVGFWRRLYLRVWERYVPQVDWYSGWILPAFWRGWRVVRRHGIKQVVATGPPFSAMLVGWLLSCFCGVRLIVDYRDPWGNRENIASHAVRGRLGRFFERRVLRRASVAVVVSEAMGRDLRAAYDGALRGRCEVVTNGYWPGEGIAPLELASGKQVILYTGSFYSDRKMTLLAGPLSRLIERGEVSRDKVAIHVFGSLAGADLAALAACGLGDLVEAHSPVEHERVLGYMKGADVLVLLSGRDVRYALPFKLYDYLSVQRPILAIAPEDSAVQEFMAGGCYGEYASIDDEGAIEAALKRLLQDGAGYDFSQARRYTWDNVAAAYGRVLEAGASVRVEAGGEVEEASGTGRDGG